MWGKLTVWGATKLAAVASVVGYFWSEGTPEEQGGKKFSGFVKKHVFPVVSDVSGKVVDGIGNTITGATTTISEAAGQMTGNPNAPADATRPQNLPLGTSIPQVAQNAGEAVGEAVDTTKDSADGFVKGILGKVGLDKGWAPWITGAVALVGGLMAGKAMGVPGAGKVADLVTGVPGAIVSGIGSTVAPILSVGLTIGAILMVGRWAFSPAARERDFEFVKGIFTGPSKEPEVIITVPVPEKVLVKPVVPVVPEKQTTREEAQQAVAGLVDKAIGGPKDIQSLDEVTRPQLGKDDKLKGPSARRETPAGYGSAV